MKTVIDFTSPQAEYDAMVNNPASTKDAHGEGFAWHAVFLCTGICKGTRSPAILPGWMRQ
jgi:hypothetical protein